RTVNRSVGGRSKGEDVPARLRLCAAEAPKDVRGLQQDRQRNRHAGQWFPSRLELLLHRRPCREQSTQRHLRRWPGHERRSRPGYGRDDGRSRNPARVLIRKQAFEKGALGRLFFRVSNARLRYDSSLSYRQVQARWNRPSVDISTDASPSSTRQCACSSATRSRVGPALPRVSAKALLIRSRASTPLPSCASTIAARCVPRRSTRVKLSRHRTNRRGTPWKKRPARSAITSRGRPSVRASSAAG